MMGGTTLQYGSYIDELRMMTLDAKITIVPVTSATATTASGCQSRTVQPAANAAASAMRYAAATTANAAGRFRSRPT